MFWISWSVASSMLAVASSISSIFGCRSIARAMHISCLSPALKLLPFSCTSNPSNSSICFFVSSFLAGVRN